MASLLLDSISGLPVLFQGDFKNISQGVAGQISISMDVKVDIIVIVEVVAVVVEDLD